MKLSEIAEILNCDIPVGADDREVTNISSIDQANEKSITFLSDSKYENAAISGNAAAIIVKKGTF